MEFSPQARWISGPAFEYGADGALFYLDHPNHVLVRTFEAGACTSACLAVAVLGYARVRLNGQPIGEGELMGEWTNPTKVVYYRSLDVTALVREGANELVVELGNGWYNPSPLTLFGKYNLRERLAEVGTPQVLIELDVDGRPIVVSDDSWSCHEGKLLFNNVYLGETLDYTHQPCALTVTSTPNTRVLEPCPLEPIRRFAPIEPVRISELGDGSLLADFGVLTTGMIDMTFAVPGHREIRVSYAEETGEDGMPSFPSSYAGLVGEVVPEGFKISGGPGAPDEAIQADRIACDAGEHRFTNTFTVHSCRYAQIEGLSQAEIITLAFVPTHTDLRQVGTFWCDNDFFGQLVDAAVRTKLNNVHGLWEDCARERLGYGGDMVALAVSNLMAFDCEGLIRKTVRDFRSDQTEAGGVPETAPFVGIGSNGTAYGEGPLLWQLAYPHLVLRAYQYYGCKDLVEEEWPYVKRLVDYLLGQDPQELSGHCLGDHGSVQTAGSFKSGTPDKEFVGWCTIARFARAAARFAEILGTGDTAYAKRYDELRSEICERFRNEDGTFGDGTQTSFAFAAELALADEDELAAALAKKVEDEGGILATGIFGTTIAFDLLHRQGFDEVVERWLTRVEAPSFHTMLATGNGALAEQFETFLSSYNHAMFSSYLQWFCQGLGGIRVLDDAVGADHMAIDPYLSPLCDHVVCSFETRRGCVRVEWERQAGKVEIKVDVPEGIRVERMR